MLKLLNGQDNPVLNIDNFYIDELWSGLDELVFDIPITASEWNSSTGWSAVPGFHWPTRRMSVSR